MFFKTHGKGDHLVVALHGWTGSHAHFDAVSRYLPEGTRLAAFDLPGFGESPAPESWDMRTVGREVAEVVNDLEYETLTLLTNCSGAYPAIRAVEHLERKPVRLVMVDSFAYAPKYFRVFTNRSWGHHAYRTTFANPVGRKLTNVALRNQKRTGGVTDDFKNANHENTLAWLRACVDLGDCRQFADVILPTLIVWGDGSFGAVRKSVPMWLDIWPHAQTLELKGVGHQVIEDCAEEIAQAVFEPTAVHGA
ncbi:MAG: alpha/beta hydrolase [Planctomycetota bacterium]